MFSTSAALYYIGVLLAVAVDVDGRAAEKHFRRDAVAAADSPSCNQRAVSCLSQLQTAMSENIASAAIAGGMEAVCPPFVDVKVCIDNTLRACNEEENPFQQTLIVISEVVRFGCEQEVDAINAARQCLFGNELYEAVNRVCEDYGFLGHMCSLVNDNICAISQFETQCSNPSLANKFRELTRRLQRGAGCRG